MSGRRKPLAHFKTHPIVSCVLMFAHTKTIVNSLFDGSFIQCVCVVIRLLQVLCMEVAEIIPVLRQ